MSRKDCDSRRCHVCLASRNIEWPLQVVAPVTPLALKGGRKGGSMKKHAALCGLFATLTICWGSVSDAEPKKSPRMKRSFAQRPITSSAESTG